MGTRAIIARWASKEGGKFEGNYHHWDGYPSGLGQALHCMARYVWGNDIEKMLKVLIDDHAAGWSTIVQRDWTLEPGWNNNQDNRPECHCHGKRQDPSYTHKGAMGKQGRDDTEFAYVFEMREEELPPNTTYTPHWKDETRITVERWYMTILTKYFDGVWLYVDEVALRADAPDWEQLDERSALLKNTRRVAEKEGGLTPYR